MAEPDRLARGAGPQDPRAHPARVHGDPAQPAGHRAPRAARPRGRRDVGRGPRLDHAHGPGVRDARSRSRRCRTRARASTPRPKWTKTTTMSDAPFRILPAITDRNRPFWTGGRDGELRFLRCQECGYCIHPHSVLCPICHSKDLDSRQCRAGRRVHTFTVNHQPWMPVPELPYVVAIVEIPEQEGLRLTTNIVNCPRRRRVHRHAGAGHVRGPRDDDVWIPLFEPARVTLSMTSSQASNIRTRHHRRRAVRRRPPPGPRPARAHARRLPRRDRGRRAHHRRHRRRRDLSRRRWASRPASPAPASSTCTTRCASSSAGGPAASSRRASSAR